MRNDIRQKHTPQGEAGHFLVKQNYTPLTISLFPVRDSSAPTKTNLYRYVTSLVSLKEIFFSSSVSHHKVSVRAAAEITYKSTQKQYLSPQQEKVVASPKCQLLVLHVQRSMLGLQ